MKKNNVWTTAAAKAAMLLLVALATMWMTGCDGLPSFDNAQTAADAGNWKYTGENFLRVFFGFPKDEGEIYYHGGGVSVIQATKKGNLVKNYHYDRVVWVETKRRYEDGETLDKGYYIRRGWMEYETPLGAEKRVARYVEVTGSLLAAVQKQIANEKAAARAKAEAEAKAKAEAQARARAAAKAKAEANAKARAEIAAMQAGKTAGETKTVTLPGGATMEMVWCPPGTFMMGSPENEKGRGRDETLHEVTLTKGFWMAKTEVTQKQWKSVMGNNPTWLKGDDLPVQDVRWDDCQEFCEKTGLQLPTEAQWEYACRAGSTGEYAGTGDLDDMGWYDDNSDGETHPVGTKEPNDWGFYDMHGNVWEWCADWYGAYPNHAVTDPQGPPSPGGINRVFRGGSYRSGAVPCSSSHRSRAQPSTTSKDSNWGGGGFRPVLTTEAAPKAEKKAPKAPKSEAKEAPAKKEAAPATVRDFSRKKSLSTPAVDVLQAVPVATLAAGDELVVVVGTLSDESPLRGGVKFRLTDEMGDAIDAVFWEGSIPRDLRAQLENGKKIAVRGVPKESNGVLDLVAKGGSSVMILE